ncbi:MAG: NosD domain-containing protein, partial [bacterium]
NTSSSNSRHGMQFYNSNNNRIENNIISNNEYDGIILQNGSGNNIFKNNRIENNSRFGIYDPIGSGNNNIFYRNILINNLRGNGYDEGMNQWDGGSLECGGNYWSNYSPGCADVDNNGICDLPLAIPPYYIVKDNFPFKDLNLVTMPVPVGCP